MARPERFELPTTWFVARYSIQLSYGRVLVGGAHPSTREIPAASKDNSLPISHLRTPVTTGIPPSVHRTARGRGSEDTARCRFQAPG